jgi:hypothetical protein
MSLLLTYLKNPLPTSPFNFTLILVDAVYLCTVGVWGLTVVWLEIETCIIGKGGTKEGIWKGWDGADGGEVWGLLGFVPCMCFHIFLLLKRHVLVSGIAEG